MSSPPEGTDHQIAELRLYTVEEVMAMLSLGRDTIFGLIRNNRLHSVREGRCRRFTARQVADYIALLECEAAEDAA
jgi:excisionase family DNA binding protein